MQEKVAVFEERYYGRRIYPESVVWRRAQARKPVVLSVVLLCVAVVLLVLALMSDGFTRNPFRPIRQWRIPSEYFSSVPCSAAVRTAVETSDEYLQYWAGVYRQNPEDKIVRVEIARQCAKLARAEMRRDDRERAVYYFRIAASVCPGIPEAEDVLNHMRAALAEREPPDVVRIEETQRVRLGAEREGSPGS